MRAAPLEALVDAGHLDRIDLLSGSFSVEERPSRNQLLIVRTERKTVVIKHIAEPMRLAREVEALEILRSSDTTFRVHEATAIGDDHLVLCSEPGLVSLDERWRRTRPSPAQAAQLGRALASLQQSPTPTSPWLRLAFDPAAASVDLLDASPAARHLLAQIQDEDLREVLADLHRALSAEPPVFCHGDLRTQNVLVPERGRITLDLIDWETACAGPPSVDRGAGLAAFVETALTDGHGVPSTDAMRAFLDGCAAGDAPPVDLLAVVRCAGIRLLQTALEYATASSEIPQAADRLRRIGSLFVRRPNEGAIHLGLIT